MNLLSIPVRNCRRKWAKTLLLVLVFTLGVASAVALGYVSRAVGESLEKKLTAYGANILIAPPAEKLAVSYGGFSLGDLFFDVQLLEEADVESKVMSIGHSARISVVAPKLVNMTRVNGTPVAVVGVRFEREMNLKGHWAVQGNWPDTESQVLVGANAASRLGLAVGDVFDVEGQSATVAGLLMMTGGDDDNVVFTDLGFAQTAFGKPGKASFVEVAALCAGCPIEDIANQIIAALPATEVKALQSVVKQRMQSINFVQNLALAVSVVILFTACSMLGASMLSTVNERIREIGLMRALGFSRMSVFTVFSAEAAFIGLLSGVIGYLAGVGLCGEILATLGTTDAVIESNMIHLVMTIVGVTMVSILAAIFPAWKASNVDPSRALVSL